MKIMPITKNEYQDNNMNCKNCGGEMLGDGYRSVFICEYVEDAEEVYEPDAEPIYCNYKTEED